MILIGALPWLAQILHSRLFKSLLPTDKDVYGLGKVMGIAKEVVGERFGPNKKEQRDMLGPFVRHDLTQREAELMQILDMPSPKFFPTQLVRECMTNLDKSRCRNTQVNRLSNHLHCKCKDRLVDELAERELLRT